MEKLTPDYSPDLCLSKSDIDIEEDVSILTGWFSKLKDLETDILNKYQAHSWRDLPIRPKMKIRRVFLFRKYIGARIASLLSEAKETSGHQRTSGYQSERSRRKDRTLIAKFMEVAKRELPKDEYKRILGIAQSEFSNLINSNKNAE